MLEAIDLVKRYGSRTVVDGVSLRAERGEIVGLLGPNGAGKTTTFYMIVGLVHPDAGQVSLDGGSLTGLPVYQRARGGIGYLAQEPSVFRGLTVEQNIRMVLEATNRRDGDTVLGTLLDEFGLTHLRGQLGISLSGGERRRVEIARVMAMAPDYLLLDEPFTGIDPLSVADIQDMIGQLRARGLGIVITDHNVRDTLAITDRAIIINEGKTLRTGTAEQILTDPEVRRVFLGERFNL